MLFGKNQGFLPSGLILLACSPKLYVQSFPWQHSQFPPDPPLCGSFLPTWDFVFFNFEHVRDSKLEWVTYLTRRLVGLRFNLKVNQHHGQRQNNRPIQPKKEQSSQNNYQKESRTGRQYRKWCVSMWQKMPLVVIRHEASVIGTQQLTFFETQNNPVGKIFSHDTNGNKVENYRKVS